jgi:hypothetical protein
MYQVILPVKGPKPSYYAAYVMYFKNILPFDTNIIYQNEAKFNYFIVTINGKKIIVDFSNFHDVQDHLVKLDWPYLKFQYCTKEHSRYPNVYAFTKISFYNWQQFFDLKKKINYTCNTNRIINMQRPRGAAIGRRNYVQKFLREKYGKDLVTEFTRDQVTFWNTINDCLVHVCVPGARNDILDRGQVQAMAFGCCTISPVISDCLARNWELTPGFHYVACKSDYSDLEDKILWCKNNRDICVKIGQNAQVLFNETSTPEKLWNWILEVINGKI